MLLCAALLLALHAPDGLPIFINPEQITSMREPYSNNWPRSVHCLVFLTDGKMVSVAELCDDVRRQLGR